MSTKKLQILGSFPEPDVYAAEESVDTSVDTINADTLGGYHASDFAMSHDVENLTAADVGARPNNWLPAIEEIGAAPAGYGLGTCGRMATDYNTLTANGWYRMAGADCVNVPTTKIHFQYGHTFVENRDSINSGSGRVWQTLKLENYVARRFSEDGGVTWSELEFENPPMMAGVEYRTTERYGGHPVYVQRVIVNSIPTGTLITLVPESTSLVRFECKIQQDAGLHEIWSPFFYGSIDSAYSAFTYVYKEMTGAIRCNFNCGANIDVDAAAYVTVWYTKD